MQYKYIIPALFLSAILTGCSTTQEVTLAKSTIATPIKTIAQVADSGNSAEMDSNLSVALQKTV